jgi:hypothetical protein
MLSDLEHVVPQGAPGLVGRKPSSDRCQRSGRTPAATAADPGPLKIVPIPLVRGKIISDAVVGPKHPKFSLPGCLHDQIAPTVGRVLWFSPSRLTGDGRFAHIDGGKPLAAIIAHVFGDALVNLAVFDSNGQPHSRTSVPLVQEGEPKPEHGYFCSWMPYQVGQAAKHVKTE